MKIGIVNLGCPKNTVDTECMLSALNGFSITTSAKDADVILINTCAFLREAREESAKAVSDMLGEKRKGAKVIVAGCFVTRDLPGLRKKFPGVHAWLGVNDLMNIGGAVKSGGVFTGSAPYIYKSSQHTVMLNPYSAYVKISDGCNHRCSFCVIPSIKGRYRSRKIQDIALEIKNLVNGGIKEINLISQDLTYYGRDIYGRSVLDRLVRAILKKTKKYFWLRLLYLYPDLSVIRGVAGIMPEDPRLCRYVDIPFQHVNDRILRSMKRGYGKREIIRCVELLRSVPGGVTIRSSFIAGYPGETEKEFADLLDFTAVGVVDKAGVFPYSDEPGTAAYKLRGKLSKKTIDARKKRLILASSRVYYYNNKRQVGLTRQVLITGEKAKNTYLARTQENAPDIDSYITVRAGRKLKTGGFYEVRITGMKNYELAGEEIAGRKP
jgi:ribosomal protein S12 methylthiotransferase